MIYQNDFSSWHGSGALQCVHISWSIHKVSEPSQSFGMIEVKTGHEGCKLAHKSCKLDM